MADVVRTTSADTEEDIREIKEAEEVTRAVLDLLGSGRTDAYEAALAALLDGTREWWAETLARQPSELDEDEQPATADSDGLRGFIEHEVLPWLETRRQHVDDRPAICGQAYGESLDPDRLERLGRYEVHLDRKLERTLSMLLKLKELRQGRAAN